VVFFYFSVNPGYISSLGILMSLQFSTGLALRTPAIPQPNNTVIRYNS